MKKYMIENKLVLARQFIESDPEKSRELYLEVYQSAAMLMTEDDFIQLGFHLEDQGEFDRALSVYLRLLIEFPKSFRAYYLLGVVYEELKDPESALENYLKAIELNSEFYEAYFYAAGVFDDLKDGDNAIIYYKKAIDIEDGHYFAWLNLGSIYESQDELEQAKVCFDKALSLDYHYMVLFNLGVLAIKQGEDSKAIDYYEKAIELNPGYGYTYLNLSLIYKRLKAYDRAIEILTKGINHAEEINYLYYHRGCDFALNREGENAMKDLTRALSLYPGFDKYMLEDPDLEELHGELWDFIKRNSSGHQRK